MTPWICNNQTGNRTPWLSLAATLVSWLMPPVLGAQPPRMHALYRSDQPPGAIGQYQLLRGEPFLGQRQAVRIIVPDAVSLGFAENGSFSESPASELLLGMQVGRVYRLQICGISGFEEQFLYPSLELLDRLGPPSGSDSVIAVVLEREDLIAAASGSLVTRVVFLEDPRNPVIPPGTPRNRQEVFDVLPHEDPLQVADELGRPLAILRIGSIRPPEGNVDESFCFGYPPVEVLASDGVNPSFTQELVLSSDSEPAVLLGAPQGCQTDSTWPDSGCTDSGCGMIPLKTRTDEFLCDGGDRDATARRVRAGDIQGLEPEDTVALYRGEDRTQHVVASNRVCLHAPRLAATRKVTQLIQTELSEEITGLEQTHVAWTEAKDAKQKVFQQNLSLAKQIGTSLGHSLQDRQPGLTTENVIGPIEVSDRVLPLEGLLIVQCGRVSVDQRVEVVRGEQNYIDWTGAIGAQVILDDQVALEQKGLRAANEGVAYETQGGARLRLVKLASRRKALPGDTVNFTLRFDNVGSQTLHEIVIADHLVHRLRLIESSTKASMPADFESTPGESGNTILRWTLRESLPPGTGGTISFQCEVQ